jgi:hypothetical protein
MHHRISKYSKELSVTAGDAMAYPRHLAFIAAVAGFTSLAVL